ncbi:hydrogenase expression/formation protein HypE [Aureitalea sp. L0-47]|uniref:hydrogenase expression/formation protein HypE n=1 Tax=Aureitalea sp. L0-47 TaxID=2816962 RepID=UPI0022375EE6|nr:hydrogenase expression/formation protein HypE [Aureitalea sp. L0-47]MCW5519838.1 hydrogenase expression/formation protein HypE [Aureitalea sp. L0-47]
MSESKLERSTINLGHGSGGTMTRELLDEVIFKTFNNPYLNTKHDGAILEINSKIAVSTDSFVVNPIFFKGANIGELAVHGTVNDVAMCGAIPQYLSLAFIVEEGLSMDDFIKIVRSIKLAANDSGVQVITGDTKVVERGKGDKIFINTTGIGKVHPKANISMDRVKVGDKIIVSGPIAQHGMAIMTQREGLEFESDIISDSTNLNYLVKDLLDGFGEQIHLLRDPTRGGVSGVLTEIAMDTNKEVHIYEKDIPLEKQVAAACEILGLDPLYVANEGLFIAIVDPEIEQHVVTLLRKSDKGRQARCIGEVSSKESPKVVLHSLIGGKRIVSPLIGEQLPRIC